MAFGNRDVAMQLSSQQLGHHVARHVVGGWAEAAGDDDDVGALQCLAYDLRHSLPVVAHRDDARDADAE
jgi:hypothetical protein